MFRLELHKIFKRKLVWIMSLGLILLVLIQLFFTVKGNFSGENYKRIKYEIEKYESEKGILTDERIERFFENYQPKEYDYFIENFIENGVPKKLDEVFGGVAFDIHFGYYEEWIFYLEDLQKYMKYVFIFVVIAFSMIFTYEKECGMQEILLSTKNGRKKCTRAKVLAAFFITNTLYLFMLIIFLLPLFILTKGAGWDTSIQMVKWLKYSTLDMNNLDLLLHIIFMSFMAINVILIITLLASFMSKSPMVAMCISLGVLFFWRPDIIMAHVENDIVARITSLTPLNVIEVTNLVKQVPISIGSMKIHCLTIAEIIYSLMFVMGSIILFFGLKRHQKYYAS